MAILLAAQTAWAVDPATRITQYAHTAWRNRDGYFASAPAAIAQTQDGYIWIGTATGLLRFDGVRFTAWNPPSGAQMPSTDILSLLAAKDGSLWIGTGNGLVHWDHGTVIDYPSSPHVNSIQEDQEGHIWTVRSRVTGGAGPLCQVVGLKLRCFGKPDGVPESQLTALTIDASGAVWIGGDGLVTRWAPHSARTFPALDPRRNVHTQVTVLAPRQDGSLWVGFFGSGPGLGLEHLAGKAWSPVTIGRFHSSSLEINTLLVDSAHSLWVGTDSAGLYRIHGDTVEHFDTSDGLSGDAVESFFEDKEHNLWVATSAGIDCFRDLPVVDYTKREGLTDDEANSVDAAHGTVWVGLVGALDRIRDGAVSPVRVGKALPGSEVTAILADRKGRLWLGVDDGLYLFEHQHFHPILDAKGKQSGVITQLMEDADGSIRAVVQDPTGQRLLRIRGQRIAEEVPEKGLFRIAPDFQGGLWLNLHEFMAHRQSGAQMPLAIRLDIHGDYFGDMVSDRRGALWISAQNGVLRFAGGKAQLLGTRNGLPCVAHGYPIFDRQGSLWLVLRCGIIRIDRESLDHWIEHPEARVSALRLDVFDGVQTGFTDFQPAVSVDRDGRLWIVNGSDVQMLDPAHLHLNPYPPPVHIEKLIADQTNVALTSTVRLPPLTRDIEIDYTGLSFVMPQRVRFRYWLDGHDNAWQDGGTRRSAFYTNLAPGTYRFQVTACNNSGVWNRQGAALAFVILPAWYQTTWFRLAAFLSALFLSYALYLLRMRRYAAAMRGRFSERLDERTRIARELHDTLLQSFHGLMFRFQAARNLMPQKPESAMQVLDEAILATEQAIAESRDAIRDLRPEPAAQNDLAQLLNAVGQQLKGDPSANGDIPTFRVLVEGKPRKLPPALQGEVYRIGQEVIRNAFRHATASHIEVEVLYDEHQLRLRVRDDGKGMNANDVQATGRPGHWGLPGIQERAQNIGSQLEFWTEAGAGTEVELRVPAAIAYEKRREGRRRFHQGAGSERS